MMVLSGGEHGFNFSEHGLYIVDFLVLLAILIWFTRKPVRDFVAGRRKKIREEIDDAQKLRKEAEEKLMEYEQRLANIEAEMQTMLEQARAAGEAERKRILGNATKVAEQIRRDATERLEQEERKLRYELQRQVVGMALNVAETSLNQRLTDDHRKVLVEDYIEHLEGHQQGGA